MRISPQTQALMLLASALVGVAAGMVFDLLGVFASASARGNKRAGFYDTKLPLIGKLGKTSGVARVLAAVLLTLADILFPICWAAAVLCVFYAFDDGIFRIFGIICGFVGFFVWRRTLGVPFRALGEFIAYAFRAANAYICLPFKLLAGCLKMALGYSFGVCRRAFVVQRLKSCDRRERARVTTLADSGFGFGALLDGGTKK